MNKQQCIVIDTNVFLAGIFWSGPPYQLLNAWQDGKFLLALSEEIFEEYSRVFDILSNKYPPVNLSSFEDLILRDGRFYEPVILHEAVSCDPDDDKFIACALAANADYIVSGDNDLLLVSGCHGLKIIKPREFVDKYLK